ncbi:MAG: hypothetical protein LBG92_04475 [Prevotellaceae bacterium]|jgi:amino acid transporter|nr:hypothetical protein [Prevotellaceae bacterium]
MNEVVNDKNTKLGTLPVYFTAISAILGAILFLRFGYATGTLGFWGTVLIILLGHLITVPTALAISEIATNTRVEGGGEYFIISRSFGLKIGSTIGLALYISQAVSIAFYIIAFTEAFGFLFTFLSEQLGFELPRQFVSVTALGFMAYIILKKGIDSGVKMLYIIVVIMILSLLLFFLGSPVESAETGYVVGDNFTFINTDKFFVVFAICFPAFTGMTAGVGLSGDLKNPGKSIPLGTLAGTITGLVVYLLVVWKLSVCASASDMTGDQLIMSRIAILGWLMVPIGLGASTLSSAISSAMVAPRTLQALANDNSFPSKRINRLLAQGRGASNEPYNASILSFAIAAVFVVMGNVDMVAQIISMFFLITYGSLCLISFLNHFGSPPSYRPRFKSKWYFSLGGFILSVWVMFQINPLYTILSYIIIILIYLFNESTNKEQKGLVNIFKGSLFQLNRRIQVFMQKNHSSIEEEWRPAIVCMSQYSLEREKAFDLMTWISYRHGFGTYFHYLEGYYSRQTYLESKDILSQLIEKQRESNSTLYIDTMISPSYTSAIAQVIQSPSISGMENNMALFEFDRNNPEELTRILDNINLVRAGDFDICILGTTNSAIKFRNGIHVWIRTTDELNTNLMILLGYIILAHPDWHRSHIKIFILCPSDRSEETKNELEARIAAGRLPATFTNIEMITLKEGQNTCDVITEHSLYAGLSIIGFREEIVKGDPIPFFCDFKNMGDILFVNALSQKNIN